MYTQNLADGFVLLNIEAPMLQFDLKYTYDDNLVGRALEGYSARSPAILSAPACRALIAVYEAIQDESVKKQINMKAPTLIIWDAYRPQMAVDDFWAWSQSDCQKTKAAYYPRILKKDLFDLGYLARKSSHSSGSTVDLNIIDRDTQSLLDMGTPFDFMDPLSHPASVEVPSTVYENRQFLKALMNQFGWEGIEQEWWHFTFREEPFKNTYFNFPILNKEEY